MIELFSRTDQSEAAFLDQVLEAQAPIHVLLGDGHHQAQVGLHHLFLGASTEHQAPTEADQGHLHQSGPFFFVWFAAVVAFELGRQLLEIEQVSDLASQLNLFVGPQQADATDLLEVNPDRIFGVNALGTDLDAGQSLGLGLFFSSHSFGLFSRSCCHSTRVSRGGCLVFARRGSSFLCGGLFRAGFLRSRWFGRRFGGGFFGCGL